jgi:7,8-dihydro-6-hydroxymethylpterin-pyrophosphokinase
LDILWAEGERVQTERLTVPHPHLWERAFVLLPLAELTEALDGIPVAERAGQVAKWQAVRRVCSAWYSAGDKRRGD